MSLRRFLALITLLSLGSVAVVRAQEANGITSPRDNAVVSGEVLVEGTATDPQFLRYELAFFKEFDPLGDWVVFATSDQPVVNGVLTIWDTTVGREAGTPFYPDGTYRLRLRVVRQDSNYNEFYILGLSLTNEEVTPTVSADTPEPEPTIASVPTSVFAIPTELPTLTPFPTSTPYPTAVLGDQVSNDQGPADPTGNGFPGLEGEFDTGQVKSGLIMGIKITLAFFAGLGAYILFRSSLRFVLTRMRSWDVRRRTRG